MSLINDMLRDLDARRARPQGSEGIALQGMGLAVTARPEVSLPRLALGVGLVVALATAGLLAWKDWPRSLPGESDIRAAVVMPQPTAPRPTAETPAPAAALVLAAAAEPIVTASAVTATAATDPEPIAPPATDPASQRPAPVVQATPTAEPRIQKTVRRLSAAEQAELHYQQATAALQRNRIDEAQQRLQQALASAPDHLPARLTLAGLWVQEQQPQRALELLAEGFARQPRALAQAQLYGHLLMQQGRYAQARTVLESAAPQAQQQADYQALLGTLYQRLGLPAEAAQRYRRALDLKPDQALWWMGLGIALEQQQRRDAAGEAFRSALRYPLSPSLQQYVEGRIAALGR